MGLTLTGKHNTNISNKKKGALTSKKGQQKGQTEVASSEISLDVFKKFLDMVLQDKV